jgi:hypothetical protein
VCCCLHAWGAGGGVVGSSSFCSPFVILNAHPTLPHRPSHCVARDKVPGRLALHPVAAFEDNIALINNIKARCGRTH